MSDSIIRPVRVSGEVMRLAKTPEGGAEVVAWRDGRWVRSNTPVYDLAFALPLSSNELAALGIAD